MDLHIPTLQTSRLALVAADESHLDVYLAIYGDPVAMAHIGAPMDRAAVWQLMLRHAGHWVLRGFGGWMIQVRESGEIVGLTALTRPEGSAVLEIGWVLKPGSWGHGYATEAARAALRYAHDNLDADRVQACIAPANGGSQSVAQKLGMRLDPALSSETVAVYVSWRATAPAISPADLDDAAAILAIQRQAFEPEARLCDQWQIPPLTETLESVREHIASARVLKATEGERIVGSIRGVVTDDVCYVKALSIAPGFQGRGLGSALLRAIEQAHPQVRCFELLTNTRVEGNVAFYLRHGYEVVETRQELETITLAFFRKQAGAGGVS